ncbi:MAG: hypothetical protein ACJ8AG_16010 [Ktedonobacteraceae bacterium]
MAEASSATTIYVDVAMLVLVHRANKLYLQDERGNGPLVSSGRACLCHVPPQSCDLPPRNRMLPLL